MKITAADVKKLRDMTGAGMMDAKKVLVEAEGDMDKAIILMRERGMNQATKKAGRIAAEGLTRILVSDDKKSASIVEVNSETDFVAKNEDFMAFADACAVVALNEKPADLDAFKNANYPGTETSIADTLVELVARIGENMSLRRFEVVEVEAGAIVGYLHGAGKIAALVALKSEAEADKLENLGKDIAMQIASMSPKYISSDDVDQSYIESERTILLNQALNENEEAEKEGKKAKPRQIIEKMVEGRLNKELKEVCLLEQAFVKDSSMNVKQLVDSVAKDIGSAIEVNHIVRYEVGEGIEKREENFAEEVAKQMK